MSDSYVIGIDLGTSNTSVSFSDIGGEAGADAPIELMEIPQVVDVGVIETRRTLPSFAYIPNEHELPPGALNLPWEEDPGFMVGTFARDHGGKVPDRLISSAKSWLCHSGIDRLAPILPWSGSQKPDNIPRISPLAASARYLGHVRDAWHHLHPHSDISEQEVVLTVPASFDPSARELTVMAARAAGIGNLVLLEEPQAALYAWLDAHPSWRDVLSVGDTVLVCDIGGGTTDFSLIQISEDEGNLTLERVAVGDHILLGGDNMDYALAFAVKRSLEQQGHKLDPWQVRGLLQGVRSAKEDLLGPEEVDSRTVVIPSRGSRLMGGSVKGMLTREVVAQIVREGFFPRCAITDRPKLGRRAGLSQIGLEYASDAAVTRHLAHFLSRARRDGDPRAFAHPSAVLFNGGVMQSDELRNRVVETLNAWLAADGGEPVTELGGAELDVAVSRGAAYFGQVRRGRGVRIKSGTARTYYVGVEQPMPAVPGFEPPVLAVCVAPFGMEEGSSIALPDERFALYVGEPARFRFFASSVRKDDPIGTVLEHWDEDEVLELPAIETELTDDSEGGVVEVGLESTVTPVGTLALHCVAEDGRRWQLEFDVRHAQE